MSESTVPQSPTLRICRHWRWVYVPGTELRLGGGPAPMQLEPHDVLEALVDDKWVAVPIVEMPKPEHPQVAAQRARAERERASMDETFRNIQEFVPPRTYFKTRKST